MSDRGPGRPRTLWAGIEVGWFRDARVRRLSKDAKLLFLGARAYASEHLTDGFVAGDVLLMIGMEVQVKSPERIARELAQSGVWTVEGDGYRDVEFLRSNRSAATRQARWEKDRDRHRDQAETEDFHTETPEFPHGKGAVEERREEKRRNNNSGTHHAGWDSEPGGTAPKKSPPNRRLNVSPGVDNERSGRGGAGQTVSKEKGSMMPSQDELDRAAVEREAAQLVPLWPVAK